MDAYRPPKITDKHDVIYKGGDIFCKMAFQHKSLSYQNSYKIRSLHLIGSHLTDEGIELLKQTLISDKHHLIELNLKFCFLSLD